MNRYAKESYQIVSLMKKDVPVNRSKLLHANTASFHKAHQSHRVSNWDSFAGVVVVLALFLSIIVGFVVFWFVRRVREKQLQSSEYQFVPLENLWDERYLPEKKERTVKAVKYLGGANEQLPLVDAYGNQEWDAGHAPGVASHAASGLWSFINQGYVFPNHNADPWTPELIGGRGDHRDQMLPLAIVSQQV